MGGRGDARQVAVRAESVDMRNWVDSFDAAPPAVAAACGLATGDVDGLVMTRSLIPFSHFNMVLTMGCPAEVSNQAWEAIDGFYAGREHWLLVNDLSEPRNLPDQLAGRGYTPVDRWDRVIGHRVRLAAWAGLADGAELVDAANAVEWSDFVATTYGMPPVISDWLRALVGRPGWIHAVRRRGDRADGQVVMARSAFVDGDWAWLGVDAPIPGVMAACFDDDLVVSAALLLAAARLGAQHFVTDIEAASNDRRGPGYDCWRDLGLEWAYQRTVYQRGPID